VGVCLVYLAINRRFSIKQWRRLNQVTSTCARPKESKMGEAARLAMSLSLSMCGRNGTFQTTLSSGWYSHIA
jgi:hypothetical protein